MKSLRELHRDHKPLVSPLAHDALSARLIEHLGFKTFNIGGSALLAARHALPDLGLAGFAEMLAGVRDIVEASKLPCLVDADDGYGDVKSVVRTIQGYEAAGVSGALLEDQSRERSSQVQLQPPASWRWRSWSKSLRPHRRPDEVQYCYNRPHRRVRRRRPRCRS